MFCGYFQFIYSCNNVKNLILNLESSVLSGAHTLVDRSLKVLQLPTHLSNLTASG